jgi:hypothetical protein
LVTPQADPAKDGDAAQATRIKIAQVLAREEEYRMHLETLSTVRILQI